MTNFEETTYTISDAAEKLDLSEKTLRRWEDAGRFTPSRTDGNQRRYSIEDLQILDAIKHNVIPHQKDLLTLSAAAQFLDVAEPTIDRLVSDGQLHPFTTVVQKYYPRHRLLPLLNNLKPKLPTPVAAPLLGNHGQPATSSPSPTRLPPLAQPTLTTNKTPYSYSSFVQQITISLILITLYHFFVNPISTTPHSPSPDVGSVQGAATNPSLILLDEMLDPSTGGLTAATVTSKLGIFTPNLTLLPTNPPTSPIIGNLYYDITENLLKIYTEQGWQALATLSKLNSLQLDLESKLATPSSRR